MRWLILSHQVRKSREMAAPSPLSSVWLPACGIVLLPFKVGLVFLGQFKPSSCALTDTPRGVFLGQVDKDVNHCHTHQPSFRVGAVPGGTEGRILPVLTPKSFQTAPL